MKPIHMCSVLSCHIIILLSIVHVAYTTVHVLDQVEQDCSCDILWSLFWWTVSTGTTLTLSAHIEGKNFSRGGHKFGIGLDFDA